MYRTFVLLVCLAAVGGCVTNSQNPESDLIKFWDSEKELKPLSECINATFNHAMIEIDGNPTSIEIVVPGEEVNIFQPNTAKKSLIKSVRKPFVVTVKKQETGTRVEYRASHIHKVRDQTIIETCLD
jgi:hypothetical protein